MKLNKTIPVNSPSSSGSSTQEAKWQPPGTPCKAVFSPEVYSVEAMGLDDSLGILFLCEHSVGGGLVQCSASKSPRPPRREVSDTPHYCPRLTETVLI
ncbi:hypothetical protein [Endozoicomonas sp. ONNA2]|uniref:hypothetical protein n=1 Tax=Endozoicomonas sp. ONNA2 TaxID=2828741 RepID=UPI002147BA09|nr:hypothetical protein [Endozoicomonas sp. ONNA2]